jgi:cytoskeletal protein RodZ
MMQNMQDASMAAVGRTLSQARASRGLSLDDVERDTRIAKRYLEALEHDEFDILPAPVYCRAFLRTYSQYLGLNPQEVLRTYPENAGPSAGPAQIAPLPQVNRAPPPALSMNWIIAGGVVLVFVLAGALLYKMGSGSNEPDTNKTSVSALATQPAGEGAESANPNEALQPTASTQAAGQPVSVPDITGEMGLSALPKVTSAGLTYVVFKLYDDEIPFGFVVSQDPAPNADALTGDPITLVISRGPRQ